MGKKEQAPALRARTHEWELLLFRFYTYLPSISKFIIPDPVYLAGAWARGAAGAGRAPPRVLPAVLGGVPVRGGTGGL